MLMPNYGLLRIVLPSFTLFVKVCKTPKTDQVEIPIVTPKTAPVEITSVTPNTAPLQINVKCDCGTKTRSY